MKKQRHADKESVSVPLFCRNENGIRCKKEIVNATNETIVILTQSLRKRKRELYGE